MASSDHLVSRLARSVPEEMREIDQWRRRAASLVGALLVGIVALAFAQLGDIAQDIFNRISAGPWWIPLIWTPLLFLVLAILTRWIAPEARGSGIPQVIAAAHAPDSEHSSRLLSLRVGLAKLLLTVAALFGGASVGREGPTVQVAAGLMTSVHRLFRVRMSPGVMIAGGAAGVAAAFNTPLAGIAFAIEELAVAYEQRVAVLVMGTVMISGLTAQGIAGNYVYFGHTGGSLPVGTVLIAAPLAGVVGGILGGLFTRCLLALRGPGGRYARLLGRRPLLTALVCGVIVAGLGVASGGLTWGTGYEPTRMLLEGEPGELWFGPAKLVATLATAASGLPGGIFAPSLSVGAGVGELLTPFFPREQAGAIILLGMAGYFVGVVRAPLTVVIILSETTGSGTSAILPLFATALIGDWVGSMVCRKRLYHALAGDFHAPKEPEPEPEADKPDAIGPDTIGNGGPNPER